jgi:membrane protease YdiL (CAAX protease family)
LTEVARSEPWHDGRGALAFLPGLLFRSDRPFLTLPLAWLLSIGGSLLLGVGISVILPEAEAPDLGGASPIVVLIGVAVLSPLVESLIMGGFIDLLTKWLRAWQAVLVSAVIWGVLHSLMTPTWGLAIWWPFLIFSTIFITWRARGFWTAVLMAAIVHGLQNLFPAIAIVMGQ